MIQAMTQERLDEIKNRLAYARRAHPWNTLPQMGDLKAMEELADEVDRLLEICREKHKED